MKFEKAINYEEFAVAQKFAALNLINLLKKYTQNFKNVYEIGAGSGVLTKPFIQNFNYEHLILNDIYKSEFMNNFYIDIGDITTKQMPKNIDIIISSSVFQWIDEIEKLCDKIFLSLENNGILAFSMFINGTLNELSSFTKDSLNYKNTDQIIDIFGTKFDILEYKNGEFIAKFGSLKELLTHLKQTGVNNLNGSFKLTKSNLKSLETHFNNDFKLTYKFTNIICKKGKK